MTVNHGVPGSSPGEGAKAIRKRVAFFIQRNFRTILLASRAWLRGPQPAGKKDFSLQSLAGFEDPASMTSAGTQKDFRCNLLLASRAWLREPQPACRRTFAASAERSSLVTDYLHRRITLPAINFEKIHACGFPRKV